VKDGNGKTTGVLLGRTDFSTNPEAKSIIDALVNSKGNNGISYLLDSNGAVIFQSGGKTALDRYKTGLPSKTGLFSEVNSDGSQNKIYYHPLTSPDWSILISTPAGETQATAWKIASPLFLMILVMAIVGYISIRLGLRSITRNMHTLTEETEHVTQGQLEHRLPYQGIDEIGQLNQAFEQMRQTLKSQWDELNTLLSVSQNVSSSLSMEDTIKPILDALVNSGASAARIVLTPDAMLDPLNEIPSRFGDGYAKDFYSYLDDQILALCRTRDSLNLGNLIRGRVLKLSPDLPHPGSIYAVPLRQEARYNGVVWVAYDLPKVFSESEIRFITNLAGEASLAVTNSRLYAAVELVRQRLDAILSATPDPILVIDQRGRLLITNPPALELLNNEELFILGQPIEEVVHQRELLDFLESDEKAKEIVFPDDQVFSVTAADMISDHQMVGKVCILRNITRFKELETLKTEFVETVSHDLRGPLTLMRGYATMMQMVGDLNEQQKSYVKKMISGIEGMSRLVNNLLDLGRIEAGEGLQLENVKVRELIDKVINSLQLQATQKNIKVVADLADKDQPVAQADQALLNQALYNLVDNGIKYTPVGGQVTIRVNTESGNMIFQVEDTGIGIAPLDQPRLFEKFYRPGLREGYHQHGSSLGLAIVKSIADRHNGKAWVESQLGKGSRFYLSIPFESDADPKIEKKSEGKPANDIHQENFSDSPDMDHSDESEYNSIKG
jgi:signal transduction histidine kinase/HAMP domain-containing protein